MPLAPSYCEEGYETSTAVNLLHIPSSHRETIEEHTPWPPDSFREGCSLHQSPLTLTALTELIMEASMIRNCKGMMNKSSSTFEGWKAANQQAEFSE